MQTRHNPTSKGLVQIYTGNSQCTSSAALGAALRASGHDMKILYVQFINGNNHSETFSNGHLPIEKARLGVTCPDDITTLTLPYLKCALNGGEYGMVILDEMLDLISKGLIKTAEITDLIENRQHGVEIVLTGLEAPDALIGKADLVTEMLPVTRRVRLEGLSSPP